MPLPRAEEGNLVDVVRRGLAEVDVAVVAPIFATLAGLWTIEGTDQKAVESGEHVAEPETLAASSYGSRVMPRRYRSRWHEGH